VNDLEDRLRRDLKTLAQQARPERIRPLRTPAPSRPNRAVRWLAPVAAVAAVIAVISAVTLGRGMVSNQPANGTVSCRPASAGAPAGVPPYYVALHEAAHNNLIVIGVTVRSSASGAALCSLSIPTGVWIDQRAEATVQDGVPTTITAAADDRTFAISALKLEKPVRPFTPVVPTVYLLRIAANGRSARLGQLPVNAPTGNLYAASLSPDGRRLAIQVVECSPHIPMHCSGGLEIISLPPGSASQVWLAPGTEPLDDEEPAEWVDGGRQLLFLVDLSATPKLMEYRLLNVSSPSGSLIANSRLISPPPVYGHFSSPAALLTPDGTGLISTEYSARGYLGHETVTMKLVEFSARTGHVLRVFRTVTQVMSMDDDNICGVESVAPEGSHFLVQCPGFGRLDNGRFTPLPGVPSSLAQALSAGDNAAW
jgi:hypothetical protein